MDSYSFSSRSSAVAVEYHDAFPRHGDTLFYTILSKTIKVHRGPNTISYSSKEY